MRLIVLVLIQYAAWIGLTRTDFVGRHAEDPCGYGHGRVAGIVRFNAPISELMILRNDRLTVWLAITVPLFAWQSLVWWLAATGAFEARVILLPLAILIPLLIGLPLLLRSATIGQLLDATPPAWLVGLQVYRVFGIAFVVAWLAGGVPGMFALPAGLGDTLVGLLALPVALLLHSGAHGARGLAVGWNVLGILDLLDAITLNVLTTAGPLQSIASGTDLVSAYPLVLIPAFGVPLSLLLHALSLRQLRRAARQADRASRARMPVTAYA